MKIPKLTAQRVGKQLVTDPCPYCQGTHCHGLGWGHRVAHCHEPTRTGYILIPRSGRMPSFREWLRLHRRDRSPVGDLARDALADSTWPRGPGSLARYERHLREKGAISEAIDALHTAWGWYVEERHEVESD